MTAALQHPKSSLRHLSRRLGWLSVVGLGLTACAGPSPAPNPALGWIEAGSPKALEVDRAEYRHVIYFETDRAELPSLEQDRLLAFLRSAGPSGRDSVRIEGHADERASDLYNLELSARRIQGVQRFLRAQGLDEVEVVSAFGEAVPAVPGSTPEAWRQNRRVELVVERYLVTLPGCPDWSRRSGTDFANLPHSNFGCATQTNLGLMIAEPRDLVRGRTLGPADGIQQAEGVVRYREGKQPDLLKTEIDQ
jgi:pilus assembly protein CpaD